MLHTQSVYMYIILSKSTTLLVKFFLTILNIDISNCICTILCLKHKPNEVELMPLKIMHVTSF